MYNVSTGGTVKLTIARQILPDIHLSNHKAMFENYRTATIYNKSAR